MKLLKGLLLCCLFTLAAHAQIADLTKLSRGGKLYSSDVIKDHKNNTKGYFLLFESDKVAKETYELEYVLLDENLKKVTSGFITEMRYESWLMSSKGVDVNVSLHKNQLLLELTDDFAIPYRRYRTLDLKTNTMSEPFIYFGEALNTSPVFDRERKNVAKNHSCPMFYFNGVGLMAYTDNWNLVPEFKKVAYVHYDESMNKVWEYVLGEKDGKGNFTTGLKYLDSDEDIIVFKKHEKRAKKGENAMSLQLLDSKTGAAFDPIPFPDVDTYSYRINSWKLTDDKMYVMGVYAKATGNGIISDIQILGMYCFTFDKATRTFTDKKFITWESMAPRLDVDNYGKTKKMGQLFVPRMVRCENGTVLAVAEAVDHGAVSIINNMYFLELLPDFTLGEVFEVTKFPNSFSDTGMDPSGMNRNGMLDFMEFQDLGDSEFLFFFNDYGKKSRNRKEATLYGIVHYGEGKFTRQAINLKTETSTIYASTGKKGYVMLFEDFKEKNKTPELRLEKINY